MAFLESLTLGLRWTFLASLKASILVGIILLLQWLLRRKLLANLRYALWLLFMARLAIPFGLESRMSLFNLPPLRNVQAFSSSLNASEQLPHKKTDNDAAAISSSEKPATIQDANQRSSITPIQAIAVIWLLGIIAFTVHMVLGHGMMRRKIRKYRLVIDRDILTLFNQCKREMSISHPVRLAELEKINTPLFCGTVIPLILLPSNIRSTFSLNDLRNIFIHELTHLKRKDVPIAWFATILQIIYWPNPLIWYAFFRMRIDRELACDAAALSLLGPEKAHAYGQTIITLLDHGSYNICRLPVVVGILEARNDLKKRLDMITRFKKPSFLGTLSAMILLITLGGFSLTEANSLAPNASTNMQRYSIILDPGHGGEDPGAVSSNGVKEKDLVLEISKIIKRKLEKAGIAVQLTRPGDELISLEKRAGILKEAKAGLFISLHINHSPVHTTAQGITIFYYSNNEEISRRFAESIEVDIRSYLPLRWNGVRSAPMSILKESSIPAVMIHFGYLSNNQDLEKILNPDFQEKFADVLAISIKRFFITQNTERQR